MYFNYNIIYYCRYPIDWVPPHTSFKPRQVSHDSGPCLPTQEGSGAATYPTAPDPRLHAQEGFDIAMCPAAPNPVIPAREGFGAGTCPVTLRGPHALRIKKSLVGMPIRLGSRVSKA
jgi:hypothetical protein